MNSFIIFSSEDYRRKLLAGAASHGEEAVELAKKDLEIAKEWDKKETFTDEEMLEIYSRQLKSFIVKLNNGNLLLYAPIRIRDEVGFGTWIETLGKVEWIVVASSFHTLSLPNVIKRYMFTSLQYFNQDYECFFVCSEYPEKYCIPISKIPKKFFFAKKYIKN